MIMVNKKNNLQSTYPATQAHVAFLTMAKSLSPRSRRMYVLYVPAFIEGITRLRVWQNWGLFVFDSTCSPRELQCMLVEIHQLRHFQYLRVYTNTPVHQCLSEVEKIQSGSSPGWLKPNHFVEGQGWLEEQLPRLHPVASAACEISSCYQHLQQGFLVVWHPEPWKDYTVVP